MNRNRNSGNNRNQQSNYGARMSRGNNSNSMFDDYPQNNRNSRSGNRGPSLMDIKTGMPRMDYDDDFTADTYGPIRSSDSMGSMGMNKKTPEQIAFDNEFEKWEQSFEDWKLNNRNHPDPIQYRMYEQKFLDVRTKLLKKRRELYGDGNRSSSSGSNPFDNQLSAADAMANSILSKFGSTSGNSGRKNNNNNQGGNDRRQGGNNNNNNYNGNQGGNQSGSYGNNGNSGGGSNDILNNELILTALKVISGGMGGMNMGGNMGPGPMNNMGGGNMRGPMGNYGGGGQMCGPMFNRGGSYGGYNDGPYGSGYGRGYGRGDGYGRGNGYGRGYDNGPRSGGPRRFGNDSRMAPKKPSGGRNDPAKKDDKKKKRKKKAPGEKKVMKEGEIDSRIPFLDRIPILFEEARKTELPKLLSGAANKRLKLLKEREADKLTDKEKLFVEYAEFVFKKRDEYYLAHPNEGKQAKTEDVAMEDKSESKPDETEPAQTKPAEEKTSEDVEMNEDELLKD